MIFRAGTFSVFCVSVWRVAAALFVLFSIAGRIPAQGNLAQSSSATSSTPTIKSNVREVQVPVIVTDKAGRYITYLDRKDFIVLEDGVPQNIVDFRRSAVTAPSKADDSATAAAAGTVSAARPADLSPKRTYLICLDTLHSSFGDFTRARNALKKFFAEEKPSDSQYALMALGLNLHVVVDSTRNPEAILNALESKNLLKTIHDSEASNIAFELDRFAGLVEHWCGGCQCTNPFMDMVSLSGDSCAGLKQQVEASALSFPNRAYVTNRGFLDQLRALVTAMTTMPTRRTVLLLSDGFNRFAGQEFYDILQSFHVADSSLKFNARDLQPELERILRLAVRYDVRFYTIDSRGLYTHADIPGTGVDVMSGGRSIQTTQVAITTAWFNGDAMSQLAPADGRTVFREQ